MSDKDDDSALPVLYDEWRTIPFDLATGSYTPPRVGCKTFSEGWVFYDIPARIGDEEDAPVLTTQRILAWDPKHDEDLDADIFATWPAIRDLEHLNDL